MLPAPVSSGSGFVVFLGSNLITGNLLEHHGLVGASSAPGSAVSNEQSPGGALDGVHGIERTRRASALASDCSTIIKRSRVRTYVAFRQAHSVVAYAVQLVKHSTANVTTSISIYTVRTYTDERGQVSSCLRRRIA